MISIITPLSGGSFKVLSALILTWIISPRWNYILFFYHSDIIIVSLWRKLNLWYTINVEHSKADNYLKHINWKIKYACWLSYLEFCFKIGRRLLGKHCHCHFTLLIYIQMMTDCSLWQWRGIQYTCFTLVIWSWLSIKRLLMFKSYKKFINYI